MTPEYLSTFPAGLENVVDEALKKADLNTSLRGYDSSLMFFSSRLSPEQVQKLPFFQNTFLVLSHRQFSDASNLPGIVDLLFDIASGSMPTSKEIIRSFGWCSFRFRVSKEGELKSMSPRQMNKLERSASKSLGVQVNRSKPDFEIWFLIRRSGEGFCGLKLTNKGEKRERGELSREISYLLNFISQPKPHDIFLDPFVGSGAIPLSRAQYFPYGEVIAMDIDLQNVEVTKRQLQKFPRTRVIQGNALQMRVIPDGSIDVIVTDPPWGIFRELKPNSGTFYTEMLEEMYRVLKKGGRVVILTAAKDEIKEASKKLNWFPERIFDVLVSGKKTGIYYFIKS